MAVIKPIKALGFTEKAGKIDILINNAGITRDTLLQIQLLYGMIVR